MKSFTATAACLLVLFITAGLLAGCKAKRPPDLVLYSPHGDNIRSEFEKAFRKYYQAKTGKDVTIEWLDTGGGGGSIVTTIRNFYKGGQTPDADLLWGGGDQSHIQLANDKLLMPLTLPKDITDNIPAKLNGLPMRDLDAGWCGTCLSEFGFLYNKPLLERRGLQMPQTWDDLGSAPYRNLLSMADPTQSSSAAAAYEMIIQSGKDWPDGWAKLMCIWGNANRIERGASDTVRAVENGAAAIATAIDSYGENSVAAHKGKLVFVRPAGQTAFTPDPIAILKGAPHKELAQEFVEFVLSPQGQALWAIRPGQEGGPAKSEIGRQPIRKDVYATHKGKMIAWIVDPYDVKSDLKLDPQLREARGDLLPLLVKAAAMDNLPALKKARQRIIESKFDAALVAEFNKLPANVDTREKLLQVAREVKDPAKAGEITRAWARFFKDKYERIAQ